MKKHISVPLLLCFMTGCSELNKLGDMHDSTVSMEKTTKQMSTTTTQMKDRTDSLEIQTSEMKKMTDELYNALRQGTAVQLRRDAYESILKAPTCFKKISEASKYFMSFELQLWNEVGQDKGLPQREILAQQAAQEFFLEIEELAPRDGSVDPTQAGDAENINSEANRSASFNALAVSMHMTNRKQDNVLNQNNSLKKVSMYTLMEDALLLPKNQVQSDGAAREILAHEARAIQLLQARYNSFQMIFIDAVSGIGDKSIKDKAKMALLGWDLELSKLNPTKADYLVKDILVHARSAKNLLLKLGVQPQLNSTVTRLLGKMNLQPDANQAKVLSQSQQQLLELVREIKADAEKNK